MGVEGVGGSPGAGPWPPPPGCSPRAPEIVQKMSTLNEQFNIFIVFKVFHRFFWGVGPRGLPDPSGMVPEVPGNFPKNVKHRENSIV